MIRRVITVFGTALVFATALSAQQRDSTKALPPRPAPERDTTSTPRERPFSPPDTVAAALTSRRLTPGRAFVRSLLIPGWGQFSQGAAARGMIYVTLQGASVAMLVKTQLKINDVHDRIPGLRLLALDSLAMDALAVNDTAELRRLGNPDTARLKVDSTAIVADKLALERARKRQREDWITETVFFTLASAVDAYIGAHLMNFPGTLSTQPTGSRGWKVTWTLPLPGRR